MQVSNIIAVDASRAPLPGNVNTATSPIAGMRPFGFNVIGYASSNIDLGESARNVIRLILGRGFPVAVLDCDAGYGRSGHEMCFQQWTVDSADRLPYGITIAVLSLTSLPQSIVNGPVHLRSDVVTAGFFWWELPFIPHKWAASLEYFDVLLSGSNFARSALESHVRRARTPIIDVMHAPCDPPNVQPCRPMFDLPNDKVVFLCTLEPRSDPNRKNPYSAIAAFLRAFDAVDRAHLVIKVNNGNNGGSSAVDLGALGGVDQRSITIIDRALPRTELLQLFASCDDVSAESAIELTAARSEELAHRVQHCVSSNSVNDAAPQSSGSDAGETTSPTVIAVPAIEPIHFPFPAGDEGGTISAIGRP